MSYDTIDAHRGVDTSIAAAKRASRTSATIRAEILEALGTAGADGLTTDELAALLDRPRYSVQPRTTGLKNDGVIRAGDMRRRNASGCTAIVWVLPQYAPTPQVPM